MPIDQTARTLDWAKRTRWQMGWGRTAQSTIVFVAMCFAMGCQSRTCPTAAPSVEAPAASAPEQAEAMPVASPGADAPTEDAEPDLKELVQQLCTALGSGDESEISARAKLPLSVRTIVSEEGGNPVTRKRLVRTPASLRALRMCEGLELGSASIIATPKGWTMVMPLGQFEATWEFERSGGSVRLISYAQGS